MKKIEKTILIPVLVVFSAVMIVVGISFFISKNSVEKDVAVNLEEYADEAEGEVQDRLNIFEETLRAGVGLFAGQDSIAKDQFSQFINTSAVLERYRGAQSIGYARVVSGSELPNFLSESQAQIISNYSIKPPGNRNQYVPVTFIEPQSDANKALLGFDLMSESVRANALAQARDTGQVTVSGVIDSFLSPASKSFAMYAPQYKRGMPTDTVEQRRQAIQGYLYGGFRADNFMDSVLLKPNESIGVSIRINNDSTDLYQSNSYTSITKHSHKTTSHELHIGTTVFHFSYVYDAKTILPTASNRPLAILIFGTVTAILVAGAIWLILKGKANELLLEQERGINEAKDNLLSLASHQLRTPATGVKQYLGLLLQGFAGTLSKHQQELLEKAYAGNERQLKTINDVLYLARLGSGRIVLSKSYFSAVQITNDLVRELHDEIAAKKHTVVVKGAKNQRKFFGDEHMIRMAVENLITNAVKYTRSRGEITVTVTNGKELRISVKDNGLGIDRSQQERMFEQFERIDNDLSIRVGGTGIGLYVVRNIAGLHGGHVEVTSKLDEGSTFTLVLPQQSPK